MQYGNQQRNSEKIAKGTEALHIKANDLNAIPKYVAVAYLFNPYTVLNCVAQTTTVWSNVFLAASLWFMARRQTLPCCLFLALETQRNFYPFVLIVPAALHLSRTKEDNETDSEQIRYGGVFRVILLFAIVLGGLSLAASFVTNDWTFLDSTYGFMQVHLHHNQS